MMRMMSATYFLQLLATPTGTTEKLASMMGTPRVLFESVVRFGRPPARDASRSLSSPVFHHPLAGSDTGKLAVQIRLPDSADIVAQQRDGATSGANPSW